ncbi:hypothetical protein [Flavihumibacter profundi]|uniref:hypothetical protein n=1 Tax=Flavihumibacter profundi TaxID=2716883 RepID=UPI001CC66A5A|nr:hypothetical protein [Flavihumibacter profundi]MBZ5858368.1 hypothetical protein [Flavihumibacter profundi]
MATTLIPLRTERSGFIEELKRAKKADDRTAMINLSKNYVSSPAFIGSIQSVDPKWQAQLRILERSGEAGFEDSFKNNLQIIFSKL